MDRIEEMDVASSNDNDDLAPDETAPSFRWPRTGVVFLFTMEREDGRRAGFVWTTGLDRVLYSTNKLRSPVALTGQDAHELVWQARRVEQYPQRAGGDNAFRHVAALPRGMHQPAGGRRQQSPRAFSPGLWELYEAFQVGSVRACIP